MRLFPFFVIFAALLSACSGSGPPAVERPPASVTLDFATPAIAPGEEAWWCVYARAPGGRAATGYSWQLGPSVHHLAVYRTKDDAAVPAPGFEIGEPFACFDGENLGKSAALTSLIVEGLKSGEKPFTPGTGFPFGEDALVILQLHVLNTGSAAEIGLGAITFDLAPPGAPIVPLGTIQFYTPYIDVPAHATARAHERCKVPADLEIQYATTHQHGRGVGVGLFLDPPSGVPALAPFLRTTSWDAPPALAEPLHVPAGSFLRVECDYDNATSDAAYQGESRTKAEMCMMLGYYSPRQDEFFDGCIPAGLVPGMGVGDSYGTGTATCAETLAAASACSDSPPAPGNGQFAVGPCWQEALVASCPATSAPFHAVYGCVAASCAAECAAGFSSPACASCASSNCGPQIGACQSAGC